MVHRLPDCLKLQSHITITNIKNLQIIYLARELNPQPRAWRSESPLTYRPENSTY